VNVAPETCREKNEENKLDVLHLVGILFVKPRCTETRNSKKKIKNKKITVSVAETFNLTVESKVKTLVSILKSTFEYCRGNTKSALPADHHFMRLVLGASRSREAG
jgi:hypothetical protein